MQGSDGAVFSQSFVFRLSLMPGVQSLISRSESVFVTLQGDELIVVRLAPLHGRTQAVFD